MSETSPKIKLKLTTEVMSSPGVDGNAEALTGGDVAFHCITDCSIVAMILTCIINTVLQVSSRVHMLVTISKRPCLVNDKTTVLIGFVHVFLGV